MNTETKLREAMKVVEAARAFTSAINGRVVSITQDKLYDAIYMFDGLMAEDRAKNLALDVQRAHKTAGKSKLKFP